MLEQLAILPDLLASLPRPRDFTEHLNARKDRSEKRNAAKAREKTLQRLVGTTNGTIGTTCLAFVGERTLEYGHLNSGQIIFNYKDQGAWGPESKAARLRGLGYINYALRVDERLRALETVEEVLEFTGMPLGVCAGIDRLNNPMREGYKMAEYTRVRYAVHGRTRCINYWLPIQTAMYKSPPQDRMPGCQTFWLLLVRKSYSARPAPPERGREEEEEEAEEGKEEEVGGPNVTVEDADNDEETQEVEDDHPPPPSTRNHSSASASAAPANVTPVVSPNADVRGFRPSQKSNRSTTPAAPVNATPAISPNVDIRVFPPSSNRSTTTTPSAASSNIPHVDSKHSDATNTNTIQSQQISLGAATAAFKPTPARVSGSANVTVEDDIDSDGEGKPLTLGRRKHTGTHPDRDGDVPMKVPDPASVAADSKAGGREANHVADTASAKEEEETKKKNENAYWQFKPCITLGQTPPDETAYRTDADTEDVHKGLCIRIGTGSRLFNQSRQAELLVLQQLSPEKIRMDNGLEKLPMLELFLGV